MSRHRMISIVKGGKMNNILSFILSIFRNTYKTFPIRFSKEIVFNALVDFIPLQKNLFKHFFNIGIIL